MTDSMTKQTQFITCLEDMGYDPEDFITCDGFDDCIIGVVSGAGISDKLLYDTDKILLKLEQEGMNSIEAFEYFEFNIRGAYVGDATPVYATLMEAPCPHLF